MRVQRNARQVGINVENVSAPITARLKWCPRHPTWWEFTSAFMTVHFLKYWGCQCNSSVIVAMQVWWSIKVVTSKPLKELNQPPLQFPLRSQSRKYQIHGRVCSRTYESRTFVIGQENLVHVGVLNRNLQWLWDGLSNLYTTPTKGIRWLVEVKQNPFFKIYEAWGLHKYVRYYWRMKNKFRSKFIQLGMTGSCRLVSLVCEGTIWSLPSRTFSILAVT